MASIQLLLQSKNNPAVIYVRFRDGRNTDIKAKTNFYINPSDWDKVEQRPLKRLLKEPYFANLNTDLIDFKNSLLKYFNMSKGKQIIDAIWLNDFINPPIQEIKTQITNNFADYVDIYLADKIRELRHSSVKKSNVNKAMYLKFQNTHKNYKTFLDIDNQFKNAFENFFYDLGYKQNTIARSLRFLKTLSNHARANGLEVSNSISAIKVKYVKAESVYLNNEEITKIENIASEYLTESLDNAKDWLLISCYCGQRVSDFMRFDKSMIRYEKNKRSENVPLIEFTQVKTNKIMTIPVHSKIVEILKKHDGNFPKKISDQKYNDYIKKVCKIAVINNLETGIKYNPETKLKEQGTFEKWELVSSHIGRRSFATNNYGKIPTSFLMYITGHATENMFLTYIGKSNKDIAMELTDYF